jgi:hypothetical protein
MSTLIKPIYSNVQSLTHGYNPQDISLIQPQYSPTVFNPNTDYVEYIITVPNGSYQLTITPFGDYSLGPITDGTQQINVNVENDLINNGFTSGEFNVAYNFLRPILSSSYSNPIYYVKEISADRTEIRISSQQFLNPLLIDEINAYILQRNNSNYFEDFYLDFGNNILVLANNILLDTTTSPTTVVINLYEALPPSIRIKDTLWIVEQIANPLLFNVLFQPEVIILPTVSNNIKGPNFDLPFKDQINNSSNYQNYSQLLLSNNDLSSSYQQMNSLLEEKGIEINIDYTDFSNFVHFSSATHRLENFHYKVQLIEQYTSDISALNNSNSPITSSDILVLQNSIDDIITKFDGYEYFLYFNTGSSFATWPKQNSIPPYTLYSSTSPTVLSWYGSDNLASPYFGGILLSASIYDQNNQDYIYNTVPEYLRDDPSNEQYHIFIDMVGQMYDSVWVYYKDVTNLHDADNRLEYGVSKDLVAEALKSFGIKIYQNNYSINDLYTAFIGYNQISGSYYVSSSGEYINNYVTASFEAAIEPTDDVNKELYKRLYHNLPYLLKTKGTIPGLRTLINCYGIPDSILRISEFGGRDRDVSTYDYYYQRYSKTFKPLNSASVIIPWLPLYKNYITGLSSLYVSPTNYTSPVNFTNQDYILEDSSSLFIVPDCIQFRFKTDGIPSSSNYSQSLLVKSSTSSSIDNNWDFGIFLYYTGSGTEYSGSNFYPNYQYGNLRFYLSGSAAEGGYAVSDDIYLPFFDGEWWSVMLQRNVHASASQSSDYITYTLYAADKIYNGYDGNTMGYIGSSSIDVDGSSFSSLNDAWNKYDASSSLSPTDGIFLGGYISGSKLNNTYIHPSGTLFSGSLQEFRYYAYALDEKTFKDYTMNPESIEGINLTGSLNSFDILNFRASLGNELEGNFIYTQTGSSVVTSLYSIHPASTASAYTLITASFAVPGVISGSAVTSSTYFIRYYSSSVAANHTFNQNEEYYFDQPIAGLRNRVTEKLNIRSTSLPYVNMFVTESWDVLSQYTQLTDQNYPSLNSEIPDVNLLEVAFSPQNEIDDDIISSLGYFNMGEFIGDPRYISSSNTNYTDLYKFSEDYFKKYFSSYTVYDYIRLIKSFDNSLFKMIKDFVPARTNLLTGIVVKSHLLERNRYPQPQVGYEDVTYSGSIDTAFISGSTGGVFNPYNVLIDNARFSTTPQLYTFSTNAVNPFVGTTATSNDDYTLWIPNTGELLTNFYGLIKFQTSGLVGTGGNVYVGYTSSIHGPLGSFNGINSITPYYSCSYGEKFTVNINSDVLWMPIYLLTLSSNNIVPFSNQAWYETTIGPSGSTQLLNITQEEFYNGEFSGSIEEITNGELNPYNPFKYVSPTEFNFDVVLYQYWSTFGSPQYIITPPTDFLNNNTSPNPGEIYLWFGSI